MAQYQIRELAHLTGIQPHTIRVWERRYQLLTPQRTATNIRFYTDEDLRRLLNVSVLCEYGLRISQIARLSPEQISREVERVTARQAASSHQLQQLVLAMLDLDEALIETLLTQAILARGMKNAMLEVVYPFLERIGVLWQVGTVQPAQEHLVANLIRQKLIVAIDGLGPPRPDATARRFVLFLPERELHELALLFAYFVLREHGYHVVYLGQNLPTDALISVVAQVRPEFMLTVLTVVPERAALQAFIRQLCEQHAEQQVFFYGAQTHYEDLVWPANAKQFASMLAFCNWVASGSATKTALGSAAGSLAPLSQKKG